MKDRPSARCLPHGIPDQMLIRVLETLNDKSLLDDSGRPHTEALHTVERFHRRDFGHMDVETTIDDPQAYTKPWSFPLQLEFLADTEMIENVCNNDRDSAHSVGE